MTNNELSRRVLALLNSEDKPVKFKNMIEKIGVDSRTLFKNLFYLEEHGLIQLSTSYPMDAVYPQIHMARLRNKGKQLVTDKNALDEAFPPSDQTSDTAPHIPPDIPETKSIAVYRVLDAVKDKLEQSELGEEEKKTFLNALEQIKNLPLAKDKIKI